MPETWISVRVIGDNYEVMLLKIKNILFQAKYYRANDGFIYITKNHRDRLTSANAIGNTHYLFFC